MHHLTCLDLDDLARINRVCLCGSQSLRLFGNIVNFVLIVKNSIEIPHFVKLWPIPKNWTIVKKLI